MFSSFLFQAKLKAVMFKHLV